MNPSRAFTCDFFDSIYDFFPHCFHFQRQTLTGISALHLPEFTFQANCVGGPMMAFFSGYLVRIYVHSLYDKKKTKRKEKHHCVQSRK